MILLTCGKSESIDLHLYKIYFERTNKRTSIFISKDLILNFCFLVCKCKINSHFCLWSLNTHAIKEKVYSRWAFS